MSDKTAIYFLVGLVLIAIGLIWAFGLPGVLIVIGGCFLLVAQKRYGSLIEFGSEDV